MRAAALFALISLGLLDPGILWADARAAVTAHNAAHGAARSAANRASHLGGSKAPPAVSGRLPPAAPLLGGPAKYDAKRSAVIGGATLRHKN
jgi:hypothetical protein